MDRPEASFESLEAFQKRPFGLYFLPYYDTFAAQISSPSFGIDEGDAVVGSAFRRILTCF